MAIGSHGRGRGGTVGHGRLGRRPTSARALFVFGRVWRSCGCNRPDSAVVGVSSRVVTACAPSGKRFTPPGVRGTVRQASNRELRYDNL